MTTTSNKTDSPPVGSPVGDDDDSHRPTLGGRVVRGLKVALAVAGLVCTFWLGSRFGTANTPGGGAPQVALDTAQIAYWTCSMHPQIHQPGPGACPICGMELVPVRREAATPKPKPAKYACAMMCVPPMERPGKCPVCGMDMVPVEDDEDVDASESVNGLGTVALSASARQLAGLELSPVERRFVAVETRMVGEVTYDETHVRTISARVPGRLDKLYVDSTGIPVREGEHLVYLYSPELLSAQAELIQAARALAELRSESPEDIRRVRTETLEATRQKLQLWGLTDPQVAEVEERGTPSDHITIYAPIGGIVTNKHVVEGAYVETGTEIYTIADLSSVWVKLDAYELDLAWLRYGQAVEFTTEAYPGDVFNGTIAFIDPVLNIRTRTIKLRVNVPNPDGRLKPGMFVRAVVRSRLTSAGDVLNPALAGKWICPMHPEVVKDGPGACSECGMPLVPAESLGYASPTPTDATPPLVIPASAPLLTGKRAVVYVAVADRPGTYEGREVRLGPRAGDAYLVRDGLEEGELVVARGSIYLDSAAQIRAKPSMMQSAPGRIESQDENPPTSLERTPPPLMVTAGLGPVPPTGPSGTALDGAFTAYFAIQDALSRDQDEPARSTASELLDALDAIDPADLPEALRPEWTSLRPGLRKSLQGISASADLPAARAAFEGVSISMIAVAKRLGAGRIQRVFVYHCPMAFDNRGARWLQSDKGARNPYFGSAMLTCGVLKETLESATRPAGGESGHD